MNQKEIIFVNAVNHQAYLIDNIKNLKLFNNHNITIITEPKFYQHFDDLNVNLINIAQINLSSFDTLNALDPYFRNGFWKLASKRIFYVYAYMLENDKKDCFHLENDVMTFIDLSKLDMNKDKIALTIDNSYRCIPGILYIPNHDSLKFIIDNWNHNIDDMHNIGNIYYNHSERFSTLPIIKQNLYYDQNDIFTCNFNQFKCIFDAAALGQYLGGIDPRNTDNPYVGFVSPDCVVDYSKYEFFWIKNEDSVYAPYIKITDELILIACIHMHSKNLYDFMGSIAKENNVIKCL